jgi:Phage phiEco32-like COOH.NH2 ligase-type 2
MYQKIYIGCDPELFVQSGDSIVASESIISKPVQSAGGTIIRDGVQIELNPSATYCREIMINNIRACLRKLIDLVRAKSGYKLSFDTTVEIDKKDYDKMSFDTKMFGCKPSFNLDKSKPEVMLLDPSKYLLRSAGGHLHLGQSEPEDTETLGILQNVKRIVPVLDAVLGNTFVLLDRSEGNIERRKHYGRAGEHRLPKYGIEYRTLSNYWLRAPVLTSLAFGLARQAVDVVRHNNDRALFELVDYKDIVRAIDTNDLELAKKNFDKIKKFIVSLIDQQENWEYGGFYPLDAETLPKFEKFAEQGVPKYFSRSPINNWFVHPLHTVGIHRFLTNYVK